MSSASNARELALLQHYAACNNEVKWDFNKIIGC